MTDYELFNLNELNGWIIGSEFEKNTPFYSSLFQLGRTNYLYPWKDPKFHYHTESIEIYLVLQGELWVIVDEIAVILKEKSILLVQPGIFHSVIGGKGLIQHFGMKIPSMEDKKIIKEEKDDYENKIEKITKSGFNQSPYKQLDRNHGFIADLKEESNINCWLIGLWEVKYKTEKFCFAYINFDTLEEKNAHIHQDHFHYHSESTEWYFTFKNSQELLVNDTIVKVPEGYLLKIPKGIPHKQISMSFPFEGATIRTPIQDDKIILS
ncbi:cupin domain-containing protein [Promethearchaeum syntrophicum]|uniref:Cupin domain-containing protein n=1 Tax=Promethearchaeum syntrophicum TaxID=2594042 RepID=A0A5B9D8I9_9ARCH|nr:cupin domain-containing protein [Candidatus Prometheoarchaeum syntrophicum]